MKERPIIRIWDCENGIYQVDVDELKIKTKQAYELMKILCKIYENTENTQND